MNKMNDITMFIHLLFLIIGCLSIKLYQVNQDKKIYYHNYKSCLLVLAEYDKGLAEFLEKEGKINGRKKD